MSPELSPDEIGVHLDRLYRAAWAMSGSPEEAEDLVQETCVRVLARRRTIDNDVLSYLLRVLRNAYLDSVRRRRRQPITTSIDAVSPGELPAAGSPMDAVAIREVFGVIAGLRSGYRDAIVAVDVVGLSYAEAAAALGVPVGTVMSRLYRGRAQVARTVEQQ